VRRLADAGVDAIPFKGPTLAALAYGDAGARRSNDLDVLVRPADLARAADALAATGARPTRPIEHVLAAARAGRTLLPHEVGFVVDGVPVDLHTSLLAWHFAVDIEDELRAHLVDVDVAGQPLRTFAPEGLLVYVCAHALQDGWCREQWIDDVAHLASVPGLDTDRAIDVATRGGARWMLGLGLGLAAAVRGVPALTALVPLTEPREVQALVAELRGAPFDRRYATPSVARFGLWLRARERAIDRARMVARLATDVSMQDFQAVRLPVAAWPLYHAVRPIRVARRYLTPERRPPS
jgi:hypothetical protein